MWGCWKDKNELDYTQHECLVAWWRYTLRNNTCRVIFWQMTAIISRWRHRITSTTLSWATRQQKSARWRRKNTSFGALLQLLKVNYRHQEWGFIVVRSYLSVAMATCAETPQQLAVVLPSTNKIEIDFSTRFAEYMYIHLVGVWYTWQLSWHQQIGYKVKISQGFDF